MGRSCGTRGGEEKYIYGFVLLERLEKSDHCEEVRGNWYVQTWYNSSVKGQVKAFCGYGGEHSNSLTYPEFPSSWGISACQGRPRSVELAVKFKCGFIRQVRMRYAQVLGGTHRLWCKMSVKFSMNNPISDYSYVRIRYRVFHTQQKIKI
jgi:hypothetical protein